MQSKDFTDGVPRFLLFIKRDLTIYLISPWVIMQYHRLMSFYLLCYIGFYILFFMLPRLPLYYPYISKFLKLNITYFHKYFRTRFSIYFETKYDAHE